MIQFASGNGWVRKQDFSDFRTCDYPVAFMAGRKQKFEGADSEKNWNPHPPGRPNPIIRPPVLGLLYLAARRLPPDPLPEKLLRHLPVQHRCQNADPDAGGHAGEYQHRKVDEHFRILYQLRAIVPRYAVGLEMAIDKGFKFPLRQLFIIELCRLRSKFSLVGLLMASKEEESPCKKDRYKRPLHVISVG